jgi:hypothetical protein
MILEQAYKVHKQINDKSVPFEQIVPKIKQLEGLTRDNLSLYLEIMEELTGVLQNRVDDEKATAVGKEIIANAAFFPLNESFNIAERNESFYRQLRMLLTFQYRLHKTDVLIDCDPTLRQKNADRTLKLYHVIVAQIEDDYDPDSSENAFITGQNFVPPPSYHGGILSGMDYSNVEDKATREAYKKYKEEEAAKLNKRTVQMKAREVRDHSTKFVQRYLVDAYSLFPYHTDELEQMLKEKKVDSKVSQEILDAVRKAEKEYPDDGFRIWLSQDKLFKTEAKLISADNKEVVIEKRDAKQVTIEIAELRQEDQDYIKRQLAPKQEKTNGNSTP